jgi:hypothetical protein
MTILCLSYLPDDGRRRRKPTCRSMWMKALADSRRDMEATTTPHDAVYIYRPE